MFGRGGRLVLDRDLDRVVQVLAPTAAGSPAASSRENSATCLSSGVSARIVSTSSAKPMLSISSASSSTRKRSSVRSRVPLSRWSMIRPGVPTTTWTPRRSARELDAVPLAAVDGQDLDARAVWAAYFSKASHTWSASSRVGCEDERLGRLLRSVEPVEDGQREGGGLAGAGLGQPDHVVPGQQRRDGLRPGWPRAPRSRRRAGLSSTASPSPRSAKVGVSSACAGCSGAREAASGTGSAGLFTPQR